jgi:hypothetical protein
MNPDNEYRIEHYLILILPLLNADLSVETFLKATVAPLMCLVSFSDKTLRVPPSDGNLYLVSGNVGFTCCFLTNTCLLDWDICNAFSALIASAIFLLLDTLETIQPVVEVKQFTGTSSKTVTDRVDTGKTTRTFKQEEDGDQYKKYVTKECYFPVVRYFRNNTGFGQDRRFSVLF